MKNRWKIKKNKKAIVWDYSSDDIHTDSIEMSGLLCSNIVSYGMDEKGLVLFHHPVYPSLRCRPNDTFGSYQLDVFADKIPKLVANGNDVIESLEQVEIDGTLVLRTVDPKKMLRIEHQCFTSAELRLCFEKITVRNNGTDAVTLSLRGEGGIIDQTMGPMGINVLEMKVKFEEFTVEPNEEYSYYIMFSGHLTNEEMDDCDPENELKKRYEKVNTLTSVLDLDTGNETLDTMFHFAKLRAGESIFSTRYGYIHSPGGKAFYAATWCNDQVEYAGPYFAYTGDQLLIEASMNAYRMYRPFMSSEYKAIPSSVVAEGIDYWNDMGDRGDAAMYLCGASRFALTVGDRWIAEELLPGIEWCAEYCRRKINADGVIESDTDELEERFPSGNANLCTSVLAYDGYRFAAILESAFGNQALAETYESLASALEVAIEDFFACKIHGFDTYRYYDGCKVLRSWICLPLCLGMYKRAEGTVQALTSEYLMKDGGILTTEEDQTIWDRTTLYALRGIFSAGSCDVAMDMLLRYCNSRLLGEQVPYAVEIYNRVEKKRQLSGESALFCKIILEGMLNIVPEGLEAFSLKPELPKSLDHLYLSGIHAFGISFDINVDRDSYSVVSSKGTVLAKAACGEKSRIEIVE